MEKTEKFRKTEVSQFKADTNEYSDYECKVLELLERIANK